MLHFIFQDESDTDTSQQARKKILSSDEELMDDDVSWVWSQDPDTHSRQPTL